MTKANPTAACRNCGKTFLKPVKRAVFCSPNCALADKIAAVPDGECWEWIGPTKANGYGVLSYNGKHFHAHKLSLETALGRPLRPGYETCHQCDNRACINPAHLSEGTRSDNMREAVQRKRLNPVPPRCPGERHGQSKLTEQAVLTLRASGEGRAVLAERYGVSPQTISKVRARQCWTHI